MGRALRMFGLVACWAGGAYGASHHWGLSLFLLFAGMAAVIIGGIIVERSRLPLSSQGGGDG